MKFGTVGFAAPMMGNDEYVEVREEIVEALDNPSPLVLALGTGVTLLGLGALYWYMTSGEDVAAAEETSEVQTAAVQTTAVDSTRTRLRKPAKGKAKSKDKSKAKGKEEKKKSDKKKGKSKSKKSSEDD